MAPAIADKPKDHFLKALDGLPDTGAPPWLGEIRRRGVERFRETPYPHTKQEEWRQTNISRIVDTPFEALVAPPKATPGEQAVAVHRLPEAGAGVELVFVDGYFQPGLSRIPAAGPAHAGSLAEAIAAGSPVVQQRLDKVVAHRGAYPALNAAALQDGAFIHVPRGTVVQAPIHLIFLTSVHARPVATSVRNLIVLEESAEATITTTHGSLGAGERYLNNVVEEIVLGPNARLHRNKVVREATCGNHLATTEVRQDRDSRLESFVFTFDGDVVRDQLCVTLAGEGADCGLSGLYLNDGHRLIDNALDIRHAVPHCTSRMAYKGVLDGESKAVFTGKVNVDRDAQKTDSNQLSNNLLLSDTATVDAKPQLEIYADDVKCTHGATVGAPPDEVVFYFRSRGIAEATARGMLTYGFAEEIAAELTEPVLRGAITAFLQRKFSPTL